MSPLPLKKLLSMIFTEYDKHKTIFGIQAQAFFSPNKYPNLALSRYGESLDTPIGVAAGPQTQLSQNIIASWLCGARYIELKTVQTLDELEVLKPCIDMEDEGFNCEWSQELKLEQSFKEYLNAWIVIHILQERLKLRSNGPGFGTIFNMSVGYNLEGILKENVQQFFSKMNNCHEELEAAKEEIRDLYPKIDSLNIPSKISNNVTLSTMHGCPPHEIEKIALYLIEDKKLHTTIKLNPTLNGPSDLRSILNDKLGYKKIEVPDVAFHHDLKFEDGVKIIERLLKKSDEHNLEFALKLTNTLEVVNNKSNFDSKNEMMYMSGRPLHPLAINLALKLQKEFQGKLSISFSSGADAFNAPKVLSLGIWPITVCSDLLKPGGYERLGQYFENIEKLMKEQEVTSLLHLASKTPTSKEEKQVKRKKDIIKKLERYLNEVLKDKRYHKSFFEGEKIKTNRELNYFDCIKAPCQTTCPTAQEIPDYMYLTANKLYEIGLDVIRHYNPFPNSTGMACDHICQEKCTRMNYDNPLKIREIKRFLAEQEKEIPAISPRRELKKSVAIIGGGPGGLSAAFFLALEGFKVEIFEATDRLGGMLTHALPDFRADQGRVDLDIERIKKLGVKTHLNHPVTNIDVFKEIEKDFDYVYISVGAKVSKKMGMPEETRFPETVIGHLEFLDKVKKKTLKKVPSRVVVIGGGNSAIDAARTAKRLLPKNGDLKLIYRREIEQMPADLEEIEDLLDENIEVLELTSPSKLVIDPSISSRPIGLECIKNALGPIDSSGRRSPVPVKNSEFTIDCELIVVAIGQETKLNFLPEEIKINQKGFIKFDEKTLETSLSHIYVGGDVARGPKSIIQSIADGKNAAYQIYLKEGLKVPTFTNPPKDITIDEIKAKRRKRVYGVTSPKLDPQKREGFKIVNQTLSEEEAINEAKRCLYCDEICDVCVSVCPNRANVSYTISPKEYKLHDIEIKDGVHKLLDSYKYKLDQKFQVFNIGSFCNECNNCTTFCPTNGRPHQDKPKLYLNLDEYLIEKDNAFYLEKTEDNNICLMGKLDGLELKLLRDETQEKYFLENGHFSAEFDIESLNLIKMHHPTGDTLFSMKRVVTLITLLEAFSSKVNFT
jgi:putative selenate reductase